MLSNSGPLAPQDMTQNQEQDFPPPDDNEISWPSDYDQEIENIEVSEP